MIHGTTRALIHNMVVGVSEGFKRVLEIQGIGYKAQMRGNNLVLNVGHSHETRGRNAVPKTDLRLRRCLF